MIFYSGQYRSVWWLVTVLLMAMVIAGCAGMEPYEYRDNREEGPEKGLFTGSQGEWVIVGPKKTAEVGTYPSLTEWQGRRTLWYPDRKYFLLGRHLPDELLKRMKVDRE